MSSLISSQTSTNFRKVFTDDGEPSVEKVRFSSDLGSITTRFKNLGNGLLKSTILENKMALFGLIQDTSKIKIVLRRICIGTLLAFVLNRCHLRNPLKKMFLSENVIFGDLGFPSVTLVNKSLKALCLNSRMVYQHLLYTLSLWTCWHLKFTQGPTNFRGCWMAHFTTVLGRNSSGLLPCCEIHKLCVVISHDFWGYGRVCLFVHSGLAVAENKPNSIPNGILPTFWETHTFHGVFTYKHPSILYLDKGVVHELSNRGKGGGPSKNYSII